MAVPKQKVTKSKVGGRRSHHAMKAPSLNLCSRCQQPKRPHRVCSNCGHYRGKSVINMEN